VPRVGWKLNDVEEDKRMSDHKQDTDDTSTDAPIGEFDQTNGLAGNLQGDDGGAEKPGDPEQRPILQHLLPTADDDFDDANAETGYSEEGAE
jgi:hypothetical protein